MTKTEVCNQSATLLTDLRTGNLRTPRATHEVLHISSEFKQLTTKLYNNYRHGYKSQKYIADSAHKSKSCT